MMAERPDGYGFTAEVQDKLKSKFNSDLALQAMEWIQSYVPEAAVAGTSDADSVQEKLKSGVILCKLINKLQPNSVKKINEGKMAFKQMENIGNFLEGCYSFGVTKNDLFQTVDLYEGTNMAQVIDGLHSLGRKAQRKGFKGLGPKESSKNEHTFTDEQLRAGEGVIGLQMGSNKGASQAGQNFGKTRAIID